MVTNEPISAVYLIGAYFKFRPDIIIPGDDRAAICLQNFATSNSVLTRLIPHRLKEIIKLSTGDKGGFSIIQNKSLLLDSARSVNIRTPLNYCVVNFDSALHFVQELGYPVVLKADQGFGGQEVVICQSESDLLKGFDQLMFPRRECLASIVKYKIKAFFLVNWIKQQTGISIQEYVSGRMSYISFFAHDGELLSGVIALTLENYPDGLGPGSVIKIIDHPEILEAAKKIVKLTGYTGFGGLDFIIDDNNDAYLLEFNPRVTLTSYLGKDLGVNMCGLLKCYLGSKAYATHVNLPVKHKIVALYPLELKRDPESSYLQSAFHGIPEGEPGLLQN